MKRVAVIATLAVLVIGCGSPSASDGSPSETEGSAAIPCPGVTLRGPDGSGVDLTGTWRGFSSGLLFVTQTGSCVAIEGLSNHPDEPLGTRWRSVFVGDLTSEFTVVGRWTWTRGEIRPFIAPGDTWAIKMPIGFDDQNQLVLQIAPLDVGAAPSEPRFVMALERISSSTAYPD